METARVDEAYEIVCPHCRKSFTAEAIVGSADRHTGFKCPHCNLFVSFERTAGSEPA